MKINNIEEAEFCYKDSLSDDEIGLCRTYYESTNDLDETVVILDKLKQMAYGLATGSVDPKAVDWLKEKLAVAMISKILNISTKYFEDLPTDTQDELMDCYEENINSENLEHKLWEIANIIESKKENENTAVQQQAESAPTSETPQEKPQEPPQTSENHTEQPKASIIKKLAYYREVVLKKYENGGQK